MPHPFTVMVTGGAGYIGSHALLALRDAGWDVVVVDCAPTAETLRLLSLPEIMRWYMDRVFPMSRKVNKVVSPLLGRVVGLPTPGDDVFGSAAKFYERLDGVRELLCDTETTSVRLVVNPEKLVVAEARRTHTYLSLFGYHVTQNRRLAADVQAAGGEVLLDQRIRPLGSHHQKLVLIRHDADPARVVFHRGDHVLDPSEVAVLSRRDAADRPPPRVVRPLRRPPVL